MTTPTWQAPTAGQPGLAAHVNQLLTAHVTQYVYTGTVRSSQTTDGSAAVNSNGLYLAQKFVLTGATSVGRVILTLAKTGSPGPVHVSLRADNAGAPATTEIVGVDVPPEFVGATKAALSIPLPATGLTSGGTYWVVLTAVGDASDYYSLEKSNQVTGASTSANGTAWTAQAYGFLYQVFDQSIVTPVVHDWVDSGARWTVTSYGSTGEPATFGEYVVGQNSTHQAALRTLTYTNGVLTSVV